VWRLRAADWVGPARWRWRLSDSADSSVDVVEHDVALDPTAWQFEAFTDLYRYLQWNVSPDRRREHEAALLVEVGDWIGQQVLGPVAEAIGTRRGTVRLELPSEAAVLGYRPWELARVGGRSWAASRVRVVVVPQPNRPLTKNDVGGRLRMLAVFSLPDGGNALNLRRERFELARLVREIARVHGKAVELRVVQYGATRERLADALLEEAGWDVVHLSGHGLAGGLLLEDDAGRPDQLTSDELVDLLDLGGEQIKLVTLSSCESAAVTATEHLRLLGLAPTRDGRARGEDRGVPAGDGGAAEGQAPLVEPDDVAEELPAVATAVVDRLDCAVLAMRYPVGDEFAIELAGSFYDLLLGSGQPVAKALAASLVRPDRGVAVSGLSLGTPALFGARASDLSLAPPEGTPQMLDIRSGKLAGFPDQPVRFVGRVGALTRASKVLAPGSGRAGVVLYGMAGAGKTACALELAYTHERSFPWMAWFAAPEETPGGVEIRSVLASFALAIERQLPGLQWAHLVDDPEKLRGFLPQLTEIMEQNRILLVLDNVESLLTPEGAWRDERWEWVVAALVGHAGLSRVVVTSRRLPVGLPETVLVEPVHALSLPESVLLARELPRLRGLIDGTDLPAGLTVETGREVAARVLGVVQGHPKLLELADGAAVDPVELRSRLADADAAWLARGTRLDGFLREESSAASDDDFGAVLAGWARSAAEGLPDEAGLLLRVVCGLEDADRGPNVLEVVWPRVWERTGRPGSPPDVAALLPALTGRALVAEECDLDSGAVLGWVVHPGVADAVRADTDPGLAEVVDEVAGNGWLGTLEAAQAREVEQREGAWVLRAARSAAPYLLRRGRWDDLDFVAGQVLVRDPGVSAAVVLAPMLQVAAEATRGGELELSLGRTHARVVLRLDPARGVALLDELLGAAVAAGRYGHASALAGDLINRYRAEGSYAEALDLVDRQVDYSRRVGGGPWTQLAIQAQRLQIEYRQGRHREVLVEVEALRERMAALPADPDPATERIDVWNVRETILNIGAGAAQRLGLWERALELNAENLASKRGRGASAHDQADAAFNDYGPLIGLGRLAQARALLIDCREAFEQADDIPGLARTLSALADVEDALGHGQRAVDLGREALRFGYAVGDPDGVGVSHHNMANYLQGSGADPGLVRAHQVAAAVIAYWIGSGFLPGRLAALGRLLVVDGSSVPRSFGRVCALVGHVPGVDLAGLLARLPSRAPDPDTAVQAVLAAAPDAAAASQADRVEQALAGWEPALSALHTAATDPDPDTRVAAATTLTAELDRFADSDHWRALAAVLRRIHTGERDPDVLLDGLDEITIAIVRRALDILTGTATIDPNAWHTPTDDTANGQNEPDQVAQFVAAIAAAAAGDTNARAAVEPQLAAWEADPDTAAMAAVVRQIVDGADNPTLVGDLPPDQAAFLAAVRQHLLSPDEPETS
jgi:tetratricopeptide (TPR) repeat protein